MAATNRNDRFPPARFNPTPPISRRIGRAPQYFDQHPAVSWEEFLLEARQREIYLPQQRETGNRAGLERWEDKGTNRWSTARPPLSAEDIRIHAWLSERLAVLHYEQHGLWPKLRQLLFANRLVRWLGRQIGIINANSTTEGRSGSMATARKLS